MKKKFTLWKLVISLAIITAILFGIAQWLPFNPIDVKSVKLNATSYNIGDKYWYTVNRCRNIDQSISGTVRKTFVPLDQSKATPVPIGTFPTPTLGRGCGLINSKEAVIPSTLVKGVTYRLQLQTTYDITFTRSIEKIYYSNSFTVKEN